MTEMKTTETLWVVTAEFLDRDDAVALMELARELGYDSKLSTRAVNAGPVTPARDTRSGKLVLSKMDLGRSYDLDWVKIVMQENGYKAASGPSLLASLTAQGDVKRLGAGVYQRVAPTA